MIKHNIPPESFVPHGNISMNVVDGALHMSTETALNTNYHRDDSPIKHYAFIDKKFKLPFHIDMTVKIDSPALYLIIGKGHIGFATEFDNRPITDIIGITGPKSENKPGSQNYFNNEIPLNEFVDISITYGSKSLWVTVNGEIQCFSDKEQYIKALKKNVIPAEHDDGFGFAIACDKRTNLTLESLMITEFDIDEPFAPVDYFKRALDVFPNLRAKSSIESCIKGLSAELQNEIMDIDEYLMKDMKKTMKFKRKIEGDHPCSKITYVSPCGLRYKISISNTYLWHDIMWIAYNTRGEIDKYGGRKKADFTIETLDKLTEDSPEFANEMFKRIRECTVCNGGGKCDNWVIYEYNGTKKVTCEWSNGMHFKMIPADFTDLKKVVKTVESIL